MAAPPRVTRASAAMIYTPSLVDEVVAAVESAVKKHATTTSAIKARSVENDILKASERARDLLEGAYAGSKKQLEEVFGGDCARIGRLRYCLDTMVFKDDMSKNDKRWAQLLEKVEIVEAVLKELGIFKPWKPPPDPFEKFGPGDPRSFPGRKDGEDGAPDAGAPAPAPEPAPEEPAPPKPEPEAVPQLSVGVWDELLPDESTTEGPWTGRQGIVLSPGPTKLQFRATFVGGESVIGTASSEGDATTIKCPLEACPDLGDMDPAEYAAGAGVDGELALDTDPQCGGAHAADAWTVKWADGRTWVRRLVDVSGVWDGPNSRGGTPVEQRGKYVKIGHAAGNDRGDRQVVTTLQDGKLPVVLDRDAGEELLELSDTGFELLLDGEPVWEKRLCDLNGVWDQLDSGEGQGSQAPRGIVVAGQGTDLTVNHPHFKVPRTGKLTPVAGAGAGADGAKEGADAAPTLAIDLGEGDLTAALGDFNSKELTASQLKFDNGTVWEKRPADINGAWDSNGTEISIIQFGSSIEVDQPGKKTTSGEVKVTISPEGVTTTHLVLHDAFGRDGEGGDKATITPEGISFPDGTVWKRSDGKAKVEHSTETRQSIKEAFSSFEAGFTGEGGETFGAIDEEMMKGTPITMPDNWMLVQVERVWRNDPTLEKLSFANMEMPEGRVEPRVAPKLMKALEHNTHLKQLDLCNANLQATEGQALADGLAKNGTLETLILESSFLDANAVIAIAEGLQENKTLTTIKFNNLKNLPKGAGTAAEEALAQMLGKNQTITKLGIDLHNPHWRDTIDRRLMQNNDRARRARQTARMSANADAGAFVPGVSNAGYPKR